MMGLEINGSPPVNGTTSARLEESSPRGVAGTAPNEALEERREARASAAEETWAQGQTFGGSGQRLSSRGEEALRLPARKQGRWIRWRPLPGDPRDRERKSRLRTPRAAPAAFAQPARPRRVGTEGPVGVVSLVGRVPESPPPVPEGEDTADIGGKSCPSTDKTEGGLLSPGDGQKEPSMSVPTLASMFQGLGFEVTPRPPLGVYSGRGILGRGMGDLNMKSKVDVPAQQMCTGLRAGPAGDSKVERVLLGRGMVPSYVECEKPFFGLGRAVVGLGRAHISPSTSGVEGLHSAPSDEPSPEIPSIVSDEHLDKK
ncbi:uncharacterized protein LOC134502805 [Candoia aspera]|uniref:uncharacterized protein LOC134502805 n=1 Tax=Candoia aspera TaxID=51853 RepID=UPI002FD84421